MRVFISHSSKDKPAVEPLVHALRERGFDLWFDKWEIGPGDDIVDSINAGLDEAGAGIIAFSRSFSGSRMVRAGCIAGRRKGWPASTGRLTANATSAPDTIGSGGHQMKATA